MIEQVAGEKSGADGDLGERAVRRRPVAEPVRRR